MEISTTFIFEYQYIKSQGIPEEEGILLLDKIF